MDKQFHDEQYLSLIRNVLTFGTEKTDRTGTGTISVFSREMRFDLSDGTIPLLTTKKMHTKSIIHELLWMIAGDTNIKYLKDNGVNIWNQWCDQNGDLGPTYGSQWRNLNNDVDQLAILIDTLKSNPDSRRMLVNSWNPTLLPNDDVSFDENVANGKQALPPCHFVFQCYVENGKLSLKLNMRSNDMFLGNPFNIAQYSILLHMLAQVTGLKPGEFIYSGADVHIYMNHIKQLEEQISRKPYPSPFLKLNPAVKKIDDFKFDDFEVIGYESHSTIKGAVAI